MKLREMAKLFKNDLRALVFDQAISSLDTATEQALMDSSSAMSPELTIEIIAHRLIKVQSCDLVIQLSQGSVPSDGPLRFLLKAHA